MRALLAATLLLGCGAPPVDGPYRGEPLLSLFIQRQLAAGVPQVGRYDVLWSPDPRSVALAGWVQHGGGGAPTEGGPVVLRLFDPPPAELSPFAVGRILFYADTADDGVLGPGDEIHGETWNRALLWAARDLSAGESPFARPIPAGFHLSSLPLPCSDPTATPCPGDCPDRSPCDPLQGRCSPAENPSVHMVATYEPRPLCEK